MDRVSDITKRLGLQRASNGNYHCFNKAAHRRGDKNASLGVSDKGFHCFACGISGNNTDLVRQVFNISRSEAVQWLKANGNGFTGRDKDAKKKPQPAKYIPPAIVEKYRVYNPDNPFFVGIERLNLYLAYHACEWHLGIGKGNSTLFLYRDISGHYCNAKAIFYNESLKRNKKIPPRYLYKKTDGYKLPLYGENFLKDAPAGARVVLVESEKTAIIASYALPEIYWLAVGGSNGLTEEKAAILRDYSVSLAFDADTAGRAATERTIKLLNSLSIPAKSLNLFPGRNDGYDLADHFINKLRWLKRETEKLSPRDLQRFEDLATIKEEREGIGRYKAEMAAIKEMKGI